MCGQLWLPGADEDDAQHAGRCRRQRSPCTHRPLPVFRDRRRLGTQAREPTVSWCREADGACRKPLDIYMPRELQACGFGFTMLLLLALSQRSNEPARGGA